MAHLLGSRVFSFCFIFSFLLTLFPSSGEALINEKFQPLKDTLSQYGVVKIPQPSDYPDVPIVMLLSVTEYKQLGTKHSRIYHKVVKVLTPQGKEYTSIRIPCFSACHVEARTIKANGKIVNLPSKDLFRTQNLSGYQSPFFYAQFAMPGVEAGDIVEYKASLEYPVPFFLDDFRFAEPCPLLKGVFVLSHPADDSYAYVRYSPSGSSSIRVSQDQQAESNVRTNRTIFVVDNVKESADQPYSPEVRQDVPGMRLILEVRSGRRLDIFRDWFKFGEFVVQQTVSSEFNGAEVMKFARSAAGDSEDIKDIIRRVYQAAEKSIEITDESLLETGYEFRQPDEVLKQKVASPHDFALFLAACFKVKKWSTDLILVNSHQRGDASKDSVFPPDLDLVFLNLKTPIGELLLDCNQNGIPPFQISSAAMNRFALGIPLFVVTTQFTRVGVYTSTMPFREGNRSHMELTATQNEDRWNLNFFWTLTGEFQAPWVKLFRQKGESELKKKLIEELRAHSEAFDFQDMTYRFTNNGLEVRSQASYLRNKLNGNLEILQNQLWDSGFSVRPHLLEQRTNRLLLPMAGEISSKIKILHSGTNVTLPNSFSQDCAPAKYSVRFQDVNQELTIEEKLLIQDLGIQQTNFSKFSDFLNQYYKNHFWGILLAS